VVVVVVVQFTSLLIAPLHRTQRSSAGEDTLQLACQSSAPPSCTPPQIEAHALQRLHMLYVEAIGCTHACQRAFVQDCHLLSRPRHTTYTVSTKFIFRALNAVDLFTVA
jgi:hypothetical protein